LILNYLYNIRIDYHLKNSSFNKFWSVKHMSKLIKNSILKYPGGKSKKLKYIKPFFSEDAKRFIDLYLQNQICTLTE
jgi:hypothetical protein